MGRCATPERKRGYPFRPFYDIMSSGTMSTQICSFIWCLLTFQTSYYQSYSTQLKYSTVNAEEVLDPVQVHMYKGVRTNTCNPCALILAKKGGSELQDWRERSGAECTICTEYILTY